MNMTYEEALAVRREAIVIGKEYTFYSEMQQEYLPPNERIRNYTGQKVTVLSHFPDNDPDASTAFAVRASNGHIFTAMVEELNGWDYDLGQFFWPDATYGPTHETWPLMNERS